MVWQYWGIGFFSIFLGLISAFVGYMKNDRILLLLSLYPIAADIFIFFSLQMIIYHYFLLSSVFIIIATARAFKISKDRIIQIGVISILFFSLVSNLQTVDFYVNPVHAKNYYYIANYIEKNTSAEDTIFGEPVMLNYVSFVTGRRISSNYLDSYLGHLIFEGEEKVIEKLEIDKPKFIIEMDNYLSSNPHFSEYLQKNYQLLENVPGIPDYLIYLRKST